MGKKNNKIKHYLYSDCLPEKFLMLPPELLTDPTFQSLSYAGRYFYILLATNRETEEQRNELYKTLKEYNQLLDLGMSDEDINDQSRINKRTVQDKGYFVFSETFYKPYGLKASYVTKLKKELIEKGFIEVAYGGKGKHTAWDKNVTIYRFSSKWKRKDDTA
ncbi:hypothetical protein SAMN04487770_1633 [Butyrivibrio sp. ob235]|uniref:hypothetical protein n=1 Tax=Butyrivibrio sp. ob235 TaxID=1761780 RepID=UPI0008B31B69|nr:hypothetical protein [Butyrivibrio sp. ob235]SEM67432.1 hypothetical protein SAMN04487770_1633 [Butyrivibrio sp. ob235]